MSVLIKGMEMPTNTDMAPTAVWVYPNGHAIVFKDNGKMKQYTEAVPVPPHGDLIDKKKLMKRFCGHCDGYEECSDKSMCSRAEECFDFALIANTPTVIEAEEEKV